MCVQNTRIEWIETEKYTEQNWGKIYSPTAISQKKETKKQSGEGTSRRSSNENVSAGVESGWKRDNHILQNENQKHFTKFCWALGFAITVVSFAEVPNSVNMQKVQIARARIAINE